MFDPTNFNPKSHGDIGFSPKLRKNAQKMDNYWVWSGGGGGVGGGGGGGGLQFRLETMDEDDSGVCSPPLWNTSSNPENIRILNLSPTSRAQAIARGQLELMEMVRNMPESSYELSLKDIVEQRDRSLDNGRDDHDQQQSFVEEDDQERSILGHGQVGSQRWNKVIKRQESKKGKNFVRNGSFDQNNRGFLINLVFPFSFVVSSSKNNKKKKKPTTSLGNNYNTSSTKVSPKPELLENKPSLERDWWKKRFSVSSESDAGNSSSSGSTTTGRSGSSGSSGCDSSRSNSGRKMSSGCMPAGCWTFFHSRKSKPAK